MPTIVCPQCENDSSIQRVSAVVADGTSTGSFSGPSGALTYSDGKVGSASGYTYLSGEAITNLASMLNLSPEPNSTTRLHGTTRLRFLQRDFALSMLGAAFCQPRASAFEVRAVRGMVPVLMVSDDGSRTRRMVEFVFNDLGCQSMSLGCGEGGAFFSNRRRKCIRNKWARMDCNIW